MQKTSTVTVPFMLLGILFNICLVASNLLETKVIQVFGITATAGLIVFPISYIINDCIAEVWGFKKARLIIWSGFISNFLVIGFAQLAVMLPAAPFWEGEEGFNFVFGMAPRIAIASLMAFLVGSFLNAYVMSKMKIASEFLFTGHRLHFGRRECRFDDLFPDRFRRTDTDRRTFHYDRDTGGSEIPL